MPCFRPYVVILLCGVLGSAGRAQILPPKFTLPRYVPADSWMFIANTHTSERDWVVGEMDTFLRALGQSGVDGDIMGLILAAIPEEKRAATQVSLDKVRALIRTMRWRDLVAREFLLAESLTTTLPGPGYLFLTRGAPQSADQNLAALVAILEELASLSDEFRVSHSKSYGADRWRMAACKTGGDAPEFRIELFRKGDVIGLGAGAVKVDDVLALMSGKGKKRSIVATHRFRKAIAQVRPPEHSVMFFDAKALLAAVRGLLESTLVESRDRGEPPDAKVAALKEFFALCDVFEYSITTMEMTGARELLHSFSVFQPGKQDKYRERSPLPGCEKDNGDDRHVLAPPIDLG